jgi:putative peptidoglycan lipid II flippase
MGRPSPEDDNEHGAETVTRVATGSGSLRGSLGSAAQVATISILVGVLIVLQDAAIALRFAASSAVDAYQLAISFPTLALNVFAGGTLLATMVPRLVHLHEAGNSEEAAALIRQVRRTVAWVLLVVSLVWATAFPHLARLIAPDILPTTLDLGSGLVWIQSPVLFFLGLASVESAVLNSHERFGLLSILPAFLPAGVAVGVIALSYRFGIYSASIGALCGSLAQWYVARRRTVPLVADSREGVAPPRLAWFAEVYGTSALAAALLGGILTTDTWMASTLPSGSAATFGYATRPVILILAFATTVVGNVTLPSFSRLVALDDRRRLRKYFLSWCGLLVAGSLPILLLLFTSADKIVALIYQRGTFGPSDTANVAAVLRIYVLQVPFFLVAMMGWRMLNSLQRHWNLLAITAAAFAVNIVMDLRLISSLRLVGIAWGTNVSFAALSASIALYVLKLLSRRT